MISNLVEACSYVLSGQQSRFRATHVAIIQYDAKVFVKGVDKDQRPLGVQPSCIIFNYCYICCSEMTLLLNLVQAFLGRNLSAVGGGSATPSSSCPAASLHLPDAPPLLQVISGIDVHTIEPIDMNMRDSLAKSVQMAIEISTKSIERAAAHEAARSEQKAKGTLERQKLLNERVGGGGGRGGGAGGVDGWDKWWKMYLVCYIADCASVCCAPPLPLPQAAEEARNTLLELQAITAAVESTGQAKAEAQAQAERLLIEGQSAIEGRRGLCGSCPTPHLTPPSFFPVVAQLKADAARIELDAELESQSNVSTVGVPLNKRQW